MNINVPETITRKQARAFAESACAFVNERNDSNGVTFDDLIEVRLAPARLEIDRVVSRPYAEDFLASGKYVSTIWVDEGDPGEADFAPERIKWAEDLGLLPARIMNVSLHANYLTVTGFVYVNHEGCGEVRTLRHDGGGYLKYTVDIPIESGDSK